MVLDIKPILIDQFTKLFENFMWLIPIAFVVALYFFFFRHEVSEELMLSRREKNRLTEKSLLAIIMIAGATIAYLYFKGHYFLLAIIVSVVLTYFLYLAEVIDMIVEKLEGRYGK